MKPPKGPAMSHKRTNGDEAADKLLGMRQTGEFGENCPIPRRVDTQPNVCSIILSVLRTHDITARATDHLAQ